MREAGRVAGSSFPATRERMRYMATAKVSRVSAPRLGISAKSQI